MKFQNFEELLVYELQDLYSAETQIVSALPIMERQASTQELKQAFRDHLIETKKQVTRLEKALKIMSSHPGKSVCKGCQGLIAEANEIVEKQDKSVLKDAALIGAAQRVEHYEIAGYGTAIAHAKLLELTDIVDLLQETIEEESHANKMLTKIAEGSLFSTGINKKALK